MNDLEVPMQRIWRFLLDTRTLTVIGVAALAGLLLLGADTLKVGLIWAGVLLSQTAAAVLGKLKGSRSEISASATRCGNSVRTWRNQANGSTPQARHVNIRL